jgi:hypothetical protein
MVRLVSLANNVQFTTAKANNVKKVFFDIIFLISANVGFPPKLRYPPPAMRKMCARTLEPRSADT